MLQAHQSFHTCGVAGAREHVQGGHLGHFIGQHVVVQHVVKALIDEVLLQLIVGHVGLVAGGVAKVDRVVRPVPIHTLVCLSVERMVYQYTGQEWVTGQRKGSQRPVVAVGHREGLQGRVVHQCGVVLEEGQVRVGAQVQFGQRELFHIDRVEQGGARQVQLGDHGHAVQGQHLQRRASRDVKVAGAIATVHQHGNAVQRRLVAQYKAVYACVKQVDLLQQVVVTEVHRLDGRLGSVKVTQERVLAHIYGGDAHFIQDDVLQPRGIGHVDGGDVCVFNPDPSQTGHGFHSGEVRDARVVPADKVDEGGGGHQVGEYVAIGHIVDAFVYEVLLKLRVRHCGEVAVVSEGHVRVVCPIPVHATVAASLGAVVYLGTKQVGVTGERE